LGSRISRSTRTRTGQQEHPERQPPHSGPAGGHGESALNPFRYLRTSSDRGEYPVQRRDKTQTDHSRFGPCRTDNGYRLTFELVRSEPAWSPQVSVRVNEVQIGGLYVPRLSPTPRTPWISADSKLGTGSSVYSAQSSSNGRCRNFRLYADYEIALTPITPVNTVDV